MRTISQLSMKFIRRMQSSIIHNLGRIRGRANIQATRSIQPSSMRFKMGRILGSGNVWITEYILYYDEPFHTVSLSLTLHSIGRHKLCDWLHFAEKGRDELRHSRVNRHRPF